MITKEILKSLSNSFGVSSYENSTYDLIEKLLKEEFKDLEFFRPGTGSLVVKYGSGKKKIGLFAHADEIGVVISSIVDDCFARIASIGGVDPRTLVAKRVVFNTKNGKKLGVIGLLAPHLQSAELQGKAQSFDQLFVDFSISGGTKNIEVGNIGLVDIEATDLENNTLAGKALDNRAGVVTIMKVLDYLKDFKFNGELYLCFNRSEEIGLVGAKGTAWHIKPDYAVVVDVTFANESQPNIETVKLGEGPVIAVGANVTRKLFDTFTKLAEDNNIKYQIEVVSGRSGTEADVVQMTREGIATEIISIPLLNMHSPVEVVNIKDIEESAKLIAIFAAKEVRES